MNLINLLEHKKNTGVLVDGTIYKIGPDGVAKGVKTADAAKLLQNERVWKKHDPKQTAALRAEAKAAAKGQMALIGAQGPILPDDKPGEPMDPAVEVYRRPDPIEQPAEEAPPIQKKIEAVPEILDAVPENTDAVPAETEWPDPEESMDLGYLQQMADAYEVVFNARTSKKTLVKRIASTMYE